MAMRRAASLTLLLLSGCADDIVYPSLAPRPVEKLSLTEPATPPPSAPPARPALAARYATMVAAARRGDADFQREEAAARAAAARGAHAPVGSDAWIAAQQAATRVEATRGPVAKALSDLDAERTSGDFDPTALDAAIGEVSAIDQRERSALDALVKTVTPG
jgi:hypothetical protein